MAWGSIFRLGGKLAILGLVIAAAPSQAAQRAAFLQTAGQLADPIRYRGQQIVFDLPQLHGIGPVRHLSVSAQRQDGVYNTLTSSGDSEGRVTGILCAQGLPPDARLIVRITTDSGTWVKWITAIREDDDSPSNAVAEPWPGINNPEQPCACTTCGDNCTEYNSSFASQDHGVKTNDGTVVTSLALDRYQTRMLGFDFTLYHQSAVHYGGAYGESFSNSYNMNIVRSGEESGLIVTPNLQAYPIARIGLRTAAGHIEDWQLPEGFFSRLELDTSLNRWRLIHHRGCRMEFLLAKEGLPGPLLSIQEPNQNKTRVQLDPSGFMSSVSTDLGQQVQFGYDDDGHLSSMTDHIRRTWTFDYDGQGNLMRINAPSTEFADIGPEEEVTDTDLDGATVFKPRTTALSYGDPLLPHQITRITDERGAVPVEYEYYSDAANFGRVAVKRINGQDVRYFYDIQAPGASFEGPQPLDALEAANSVTRVIDREGNITDHENHSQAGGPISGAGKFGLRRKVYWTESGQGNPPLREDEPLFWEMRQLHDCDCLAPVQVSQPFRSDDDLQFDALKMPLDYPSEFFEYGGDPVHRQVTAYEYRGFGESIRWEKTYDTFERFSRELTYREPRAFDDNPIYDGLDFTHFYQYDEAGNRVRHDAPNVTRGVDQPQAITESWEYNEFGQLVRHTDPNGNITGYSYHEGGLLGLSPGDINSQGTYRGYLASMTRGTSGSADPATDLTTRYLVNNLGMVTRRTDPKGFEYTYVYNDLKEKTAEFDAEVTLSNGRRLRYQTQYVYDGSGNRIMSRRSNVGLDGQPLPNRFVDRSQSFDDVNNLLSTRVEVDSNDANDLITRYAYDRNDQLAIVRQPEGNRTFHVYDERRLRFKTFYGIAPSTDGSPSQSYPADKTAQDLGGASFVGFTATRYDARYNADRMRDGRGNFSDHFYDFYNRRLATSDQNENGMAYEYDDASNALTHSGGAVSKTTGEITELLERSYYRYDEIGRRYQSVLDIDLSSDESPQVDPDDGANSSYDTLFDPGSRVVTRFDAEGNPTFTDYDAADRTLNVTDALDNMRSYVYDNNSNVVRISELEMPGPNAQGVPETYVTTHDYDELNRRTESHIRGLDGNSIDHETFYDYDSRHNTRLVEDAEGNFTRSTFDDFNRVILTQRFNGDPDAQAIAAGVTELIHYEYRYDRNSRKTHDIALSDVTDPIGSQQATLYFYDNLDRLVTTVYPDADDFRVSLEGAAHPVIDLSNPDGDDGIFDRVEVEYDENSNVVGTTEQRGVQFSNLFDPGNRLTDQIISLPPDVPGTDRQDYAYDSLNRLVQARNNYSRVDRGYDPLSRLALESQWIRLDGSGFENGWERPVDLNFEYDRQSNRTRVLVIDNTEGAGTIDLETVHTYDPLNRMDGIDAEYFDRPLHDIADYTYLGPWRVRNKILGNGATLTNLYDPKRRISEHAWRDATPEQNILVGFQYDYDDVDNPLYERFLHDLGLYDNYQYNERYELIGVTYRDPQPHDYRTFPGPYRDSFNYDDNFNRRTASFGDPFGNLPNTEDTYAINKANEYTAINRQDGVSPGPPPSPLEPPEHDDAGNMTRFPTRPAAGGVAGQSVNLQATWDAYNMLFTASVPDPDLVGGQFLEDYRCDAFHRRIVKVQILNDGCAACPELTGRRYIYEGWTAVEERVFDGALTSEVPSEIDDRPERIYGSGRRIDEPVLVAIDGDGDSDLDGGGVTPNTSDGMDFEYYYLRNRLGSVMSLVDAKDNRMNLEYYRYEAYGIATVLGIVDEGLAVGSASGDNLEDTPKDLGDNNQTASGSISTFRNVYMFASRRSDDRTGLLYYRHRYYEPGSGRFVGRDPLKLSLGRNLLAYALNLITNLIDPFGLDEQEAAKNEAEAWKKHHAKVQMYLDFWISHMNIHDVTGKAELSDLCKENLLTIIRLVSWVESQHGTGSGNHPAKDPMQTGNPNDKWWRELTGQIEDDPETEKVDESKGNRFIGGPKAPNYWGGEIAEKIKKAAKKAKIPGKAYDITGTLADKTDGHKDANFNADMSYFWGTLYLLHMVRDEKFYRCDCESLETLIKKATDYNGGGDPDYGDKLKEACKLVTEEKCKEKEKTDKD